MTLALLLINKVTNMKLLTYFNQEAAFTPASNSLPYAWFLSLFLVWANRTRVRTRVCSFCHPWHCTKQWQTAQPEGDTNRRDSQVLSRLWHWDYRSGCASVRNFFGARTHSLLCVRALFFSHPLALTLFYAHTRCLPQSLSRSRARAVSCSLTLSLPLRHYRYYRKNLQMMMIAFITIKSSLVPLIEGLCTQIQELRLEIIGGLRSHLLLFFFGRKNMLKKKSS